MLMIDEIRNAINDFWASKARPPERIYLGLNQESRLKDEVLLVNVSQLRDRHPRYIKMKITDNFDGIRIYYVKENDHFHVC